MDFLVQQAQRIARERAEIEAQGGTPPPLPSYDWGDVIDDIKDQFITKEEKEAKSKKKREEIEERERREREAAAPTLADIFSGFKFGSGAAPVKMAQPDYYKEHRNVVGLLNKTGKALLKEGKDQQEEATAMAKKMGAPNPFYHLRGAAKDNELNMRKEGDDYRNWGYDEEEEVEAPPPEQPKFVFGDNFDPEKFLKPQPYDPNNPMMFMVGGMINPFDKDGNLLPQFQRDPTVDDSMFHPEFDWIENERRTTNPFYHLQGAGFLDDLKDGMNRNKPLTDLLGKAGNFLVGQASDALLDMITGGIAHNPKGHTTRNNNLTKQKPQKKKFCGFKSKVFEHKPYDPPKMHKFRAATCGGPLSHGGRPTGAKNKEGYVRSGEFTERRKQYGESKKFRERIMGEGRQLQLMPDEDDLVSKKENPVVDKIIHEPMDDGDIRAYFPKARVMRYCELADYDDIEELLPNDKSYVFLLYQHRPNDGHFVCLMRYGKTIEFFCSYGSKIDGPLYWTPLPARQALGEGKPYLSMLLKKAGKRFKAIHNPVAFQSKKGGVATCGAYCVMRINQLVNHNQDLHEFIDWMEEIKKETGLSYDEIAANYVNKR